MEININCEKHLNSKIFLFCLKKECTTTRLMCHKCNTLHENHSFCTFKNVYQMTSEIRNKYKQLMTRYQDINLQILGQLKSLENQFKRTLENFYRISFIADIETTLNQKTNQNSDIYKSQLEALAQTISENCVILDGKLELKIDSDQIRYAKYNIERIVNKFKSLNESLDGENKHTEISILPNFNQQSLPQPYKFQPKEQIELHIQCKQKFQLAGVVQCFVSIKSNDKKSLNLEYSIHEQIYPNQTMISWGQQERFQIFRERHYLDRCKKKNDTTYEVLFNQKITLHPNTKYIISVINCLDSELQLTQYDTNIINKNKYFDILQIEHGQFPQLLIRDIK